MLLVMVCFAMAGYAIAYQNTTHGTSDQKFLMILFDGLRWDYLDMKDLTNFKRFEETGVRAVYMEHDFPTLSYPGYYTILTGLHPESHGFISNHMYDPERRKFFDMHRSNETFWWDQTEPLWTAAMKGGKKTHVYLWPGCQFPIHGISPTFCQPYEPLKDIKRFEENIKSIVEKFASGVADVGFVYTELTDYLGHKFGPESPEIKQAMRDLDRVMGNILDNFASKSLEVNIILVSDHGMTWNGNPNKTTIRISDVVNVDHVDRFIEYGAAMGITPKLGHLDVVYKSLQNIPCLHVWKKEDIPEELHYKHNDRIAPILVVAKHLCYIQGVDNSTKQFPLINLDPVSHQLQILEGDHGFLTKDNKDMRAIFLANGPAIIGKGSWRPIYATDVYNLAVSLIGVDGHPNNGTWSHVSGILKSSSIGLAAPQLLIAASLMTYLIWMRCISVSL